MKKLALGCMLVLLVIGTTQVAYALPFFEVFGGQPRQAVYEGQSYLYRFDFWYQDGDRPGVPNANKDNSSLSLFNDVSGIFGEYDSAVLTIRLSSDDWASETAGFNLRLLSGGSHDYDLGTVTFWRDNDNIYTFSHTFTSQQLNYFDDSGRAIVQIEAPSTPWWNYNDFYINSVKLNVASTPIPEPASMSLLGLGLLGLARRLRRK